MKLWDWICGRKEYKVKVNGEIIGLFKASKKATNEQLMELALLIIANDMDGKELGVVWDIGVDKSVVYATTTRTQHTRKHDVKVLLPVSSTMFEENEEPGRVIHLDTVTKYVEAERKYAAQRAAKKKQNLVERKKPT